MNGQVLPYDLLIILKALTLLGFTKVSVSFLIDLREIFLPEYTFDARPLDIDPLIKLNILGDVAEFIKRLVNPYSKKSINDVTYIETLNYVTGEKENNKWMITLNSDKTDDLIESLLLSSEWNRLLKNIKEYGLYCIKYRYSIERHTKILSKKCYTYGMLISEYNFEDEKLNNLLTSFLEKIIKIPFKKLSEYYRDYDMYTNISKSYRTENYDEYIERVYYSKKFITKKVLVCGISSLVEDKGDMIEIHIKSDSTAIVYIPKTSLKVPIDYLRNKILAIIGIPYINNGIPSTIALRTIERMPVNRRMYEKIRLM